MSIDFNALHFVSTHANVIFVSQLFVNTIFLVYIFFSPSKTNIRKKNIFEKNTKFWDILTVIILYYILVFQCLMICVWCVFHILRKTENKVKLLLLQIFNFLWSIKIVNQFNNLRYHSTI